MKTKPFEELMSEINSMNIAEALKNAEKCLEAFEPRDIIKQQQETIERQLEEINRLLLRIDILAGEKSLCEIRARHCIAEYKAEAVKDSFEKLKQELYKIPQHHFTLLAVEETMKKVKKEMAGDTK